MNQPVLDGLVKSGSVPFNVIPAEAGIQSLQMVLDSRLRGSDGSGTFYESIILNRSIRIQSVKIDMDAQTRKRSILAAIIQITTQVKTIAGRVMHIERNEKETFGRRALFQPLAALLVSWASSASALTNSPDSYSLRKTWMISGSNWVPAPPYMISRIFASGMRSR